MIFKEKDKDFCNVVMSSGDTKLLVFNQYKKSDKTDLECLIQKFHGCKNNPEYSSTTEVGQHIPSGFQSQQYRQLRKHWK